MTAAGWGRGYELNDTQGGSECNTMTMHFLLEWRLWYNLHEEICMKLTKKKERKKSWEKCGQRCLFFVVGDDKSRFSLSVSSGASRRLVANNSATPITCKEERSPCLGLHGDGYLILQVDANVSWWGGPMASNSRLVLPVKLNSKQQMEINMFYHRKCNKSVWSCDQMDYYPTLSILCN